MKTYISFLRGINVSGQKKINMNDLKELFLKMNFSKVITYIQSGNVIFQSNKNDSKSISSQIENRIFERYKFEVPVIVRRVEELRKIIDANPFLKEKDIDVERLHITFLSDKPLQEYVDKIKDLDFKPDRFKIIKNEIYVYCPDGYGRTKINNNYFENKLKVTATTRNLRTIKEMINMSENVE